jgi:hypothetical protein
VTNYYYNYTHSEVDDDNWFKRHEEPWPWEGLDNKHNQTWQMPRLVFDGKRQKSFSRKVVHLKFFPSALQTSVIHHRCGRFHDVIAFLKNCLEKIGIFSKKL